MTVARFYGEPPPGDWGSSFPGRFVVIEGTDGVGRSTHIALLKEWLEERGYAVLDTGFTRSELVGPGIQRAKTGHTLDAITLNLFYATDFWDRLERQIVPALRAGMVVLADRYVFSLVARAAVRGVSREWMMGVYGFALIPDAVFYLDIDLESLLPRVLSGEGFDYWESGQDFLAAKSVYESFVEYQTRLLEEFRRLAAEYDMKTIDARASAGEVFEQLRSGLAAVIRGMESESAST